MSKINGKAIYSPKGKAGEYAKYAVNFYVGCSNDCTYCYCKRGILGHAMGAPVAALKKCFKNTADAITVFSRELQAHLNEFREHGLFFTFTSDPFLPETIELTIMAVNCCVDFKVPVKLLTKRADFIDKLPWYFFNRECYTRNVAFGFTLTGHDELEPGASTNAERIEAMKQLHKMGFKTFASIEPVISLPESSQMIVQTMGFCDLYKIGLLSGHKAYCKNDVVTFVLMTSQALAMFRASEALCKPHIYWKDSIFDYIGYTRKELDEANALFTGLLVNADFDIFSANISAEK
ncbi:MAG: radical SAM protein [Prevotella sp.]|nr:radical SAM protein [Prevotella sp.]